MTSSNQDQQIICSLNAQRTRFLSLLTPQPRYTPVSPYPKYNQKQLDMRRKVEVLKYDKNSTQGSKLTKSQKWSQLSTNKQGSTICYKNPYLPTPSSACGVPGPLTYLTYDPKVPLYNYSGAKDVYTNFTETVSIPWSTSINTTHVIAANAVETNLFTLAIQNAPNTAYTYQFTAPIGIYVSGNNTNTSDVSGNISIIGATLNVYYYVGKLDSTNAPIYTQSVSSTYTPIFSNNTTFTTTNIANHSTSNYFEAIQYIGNINVPNIQLPTQYSYVYDFNLIFEVENNNTNNTSNIANFSYGAYLNTDQTTKTKNCTVVPQSNTTIKNYQTFALRGV